MYKTVSFFLPGLPENHLCSTMQKSRSEMIELFRNNCNNPSVFETKVQSLFCLGTLS